MAGGTAVAIYLNYRVSVDIDLFKKSSSAGLEKIWSF
ncbi:MAG TPA: hypothetical protein ACFYEL_09810 [Candidatus Wunengus californicus]